MRVMQDSIQLWDIAGVDGLQVMKTVVGPSIDRIAPFQSMEVKIDQVPCSILRLCEGNFRIRFQGDASDLLLRLNTAIEGQRVWLQQFPWLGSMLAPEAIALRDLSSIAIPKPPFHLSALALHCAAPARMDGISVLVWRHLLDGRDRLELQVARTQFEAIATRLTALLPLERCKM